MHFYNVLRAIKHQKHKVPDHSFNDIKKKGNKETNFIIVVTSEVSCNFGAEPYIKLGCSGTTARAHAVAGYSIRVAIMMATSHPLLRGMRQKKCICGRFARRAHNTN